MSTRGARLLLERSLRHFALLGLTCALLTVSNWAFAQACCSASSAVSPGRLGLDERALVGVQPSVSATIGSFDDSRQFHSNEAGSSQLETRLTAFATARILRRLQLGLTAPAVVSFRKSETSGSETGGGFGDVGVNLRYDLLWDRERRWFPGIGLIGGLTAPTGRGPGESQSVLATDVTGLGVWQWSGGVWLEHSFDDWLVTAAGLIGFRSRADYGVLKSQLAPQFTGILALGYNASHSVALAAVATYLSEGQARIDGESVPQSGRSQTHLSLGVSWAFAEDFRLLASAYLDPPLPGLSKNQIATAGGLLNWVWTFPSAEGGTDNHDDCSGSNFCRVHHAGHPSSHRTQKEHHPID